MIRRSTYEVLGGLDERVQSADWDLYYTLRKREQVVGDVKRCMVVGASFVHHFIRATIKSKREPFACTHERWTIDQKWSQAEQAELWCKPAEFSASSVGQRLARTSGETCEEIGSGVGSCHGLAPALGQPRPGGRAVPTAVSAGGGTAAQWSAVMTSASGLSTLACVVITKNEEANIQDCLKSVQWADELIVVDAESRDRTVELAGWPEQGLDSPLAGFGPQKNFGMTQTSSDWILILDADERVTEALRGEIKTCLDTWK